MPAKVKAKLKGMIFAERQPRTSHPPHASVARDDSRAGLISPGRREGGAVGETDIGEESDDVFGSDMTSKNKDDDGEKANSQTKRSSRGTSCTAVGARSCEDISPRDKPRLHWQRMLEERMRGGAKATKGCIGRRPQHDSTSRVHIGGGGGSDDDDPPIRHYMQSNNNTPIRLSNLRNSGNGAAGTSSAAGNGITKCSRDVKKSDVALSTSETDCDNQRLLINVGGVRHETHVTTLRNVPCTRLSRLAEWHVTSGGGRLEYFFDRHPAVFSSIIDFYRTGELHVPLEVCGAVVKRELDFWQIEEYQIKACCWRHYRSYIENQRILNSFNRSLEHEQDTIDLSSLSGWRLWQVKLWLIMDHPRTSKIAMVYGITSFLFVAASIAGFCLETLPGLRPTIMSNTSNTSCDGGENTDEKLHVMMTSNSHLNNLDFTCTVFFTLELVVRFIVSPSKKSFVLNPMNIIDLLALVPLYVQVIFEQSNLQSCYMSERFVIEIMFILRIFRMFRIFHLVKHYQALKVLVYALRASLQELLMLFIFLLIAMLIFATMIYYAERSDDYDDAKSHFSTIPIGFWWAIITMTTVGYGDVTPSTPVGYIVGTACSVCGVLLVALTFPVISNNFSLFYEHVRSRSLSPRNKDALNEEDEEEEDEYLTDLEKSGASSKTTLNRRRSSKRQVHHSQHGLDNNKTKLDLNVCDEDLGFMHDAPPLYGSMSVNVHSPAPKTKRRGVPRRHSHLGAIRTKTNIGTTGGGEDIGTMNGQARTVTPTETVVRSSSVSYIPLAKFSDSDLTLQENVKEDLL